MPDLLKTKYEYIHFSKQQQKEKTSVWLCRNNKTEEPLGNIEWAAGWRQYVFDAEPDAEFSSSCLIDIATFMKDLRGYELAIRGGRIVADDDDTLDCGQGLPT